MIDSSEVLKTIRYPDGSVKVVERHTSKGDFLTLTYRAESLQAISSYTQRNAKNWEESLKRVEAKNAVKEIRKGNNPLMSGQERMSPKYLSWEELCTQIYRYFLSRDDEDELANLHDLTSLGDSELATLLNLPSSRIRSLKSRIRRMSDRRNEKRAYSPEIDKDAVVIGA